MPKVTHGQSISAIAIARIQKSLQSMEQTRKYVRLILMEKVESENG